jgi:hypothetical protein
VRETGGGAPAFVAFVAPAEVVSGAELRSFARSRVPEHLVPGAYVVLEDEGLTAEGRIDRSALPSLDQDRPEVPTGYVPPSGPVEEVLARIWAEVFALDRVGAHDNFFQLGGHSLLATQVVARASDAFEVELPLRRLFETPTIAALAQSLDRDADDPQRLEQRARLLLRLDRLTDEEVESLLRERLAAKGAVEV